MPYLDLGAKETGGLDLGAQESSSTLALTVSSSDTLSLSDAAISNFGSIYGFTDTITLSDELNVLVISNRKKVWEILVSDILSIGDALLTFSPYVTGVSDSVALSDDHSRTFARLQTVSDAISLSDSIFTNSSLGDSLALSDAAAYSLAIVQPTDYTFLLADQLAIGESATYIDVPDFLSINDTINLSDRALVRFNSNLNSYLRRYLNDVPTPLS